MLFLIALGLVLDFTEERIKYARETPLEVAPLGSPQARVDALRDKAAALEKLRATNAVQADKLAAEIWDAGARLVARQKRFGRFNAAELKIISPTVALMTKTNPNHERKADFVDQAKRAEDMIASNAPAAMRPTLSQQDVRATFDEVRPQIQSCARRANQPGLVSALIKFIVSAQGDVAKHEISAPAGPIPTVFEECMNTSIRGWMFPAPGEPVAVTYPIVVLPE